MASDSTTTHSLGQPDHVHLDSAFERVSGNVVKLPMATMAYLGAHAAIDFKGLDVEPSEARISPEFLAAVLDTKEGLAPTAQENYTAERQPVPEAFSFG